MRENDVIRYLAGLTDQQIAQVLSQARSVNKGRAMHESIANKLSQFAPMLGGAPEPLVSAPIWTALKNQNQEESDG